MLTVAKAALLVVALFPLTAFLQDGAAPGEIPEYTGDGQLKLPTNYRQWVYLSSGFDMSYSPGAAMAGHHMFDNVFVNPESYKAFVKTGTWPDKTMLVSKYAVQRDVAPSPRMETTRATSWDSRCT